MRRSCVLLILLGACGAESDLTNAFVDSNSELHALHVAAFQLDEWPATFNHDCPDGGQIEMETVEVEADGSPTVLLHRFLDCAIGTRTVNGRLDYHDIEDGLCGGSGFGYDIFGELTVTGDASGDCEVNAHEECDVLSGRACGQDL